MSWPSCSGGFWWMTTACGTSSRRSRTKSRTSSGRTARKRPGRGWRPSRRGRVPAAKRCWNRFRWPPGMMWITGRFCGGLRFPGRFWRWTATPSITFTTPTDSSITATCPWWSRRRPRRKSGSRTSSSPWIPPCPPPVRWCASFWPAPTPFCAAPPPLRGR